MENVKLFLNKVKDDAVLQEKINALKGKTQTEVMEIILALAKEYDTEFTKEDFVAFAEKAKAAAIESGELNEDELETVAGGIRDQDFMLSIVSFTIFCVIGGGLSLVLC